jgi:hypothetical protein
MRAKGESQETEKAVEELVSKAKSADGDQLLDALASILNKLIEERKAGQPEAATSATPHVH